MVIGLIGNPILTEERSRRKNVLMNILLEQGSNSILTFQSRNGLKIDGVFGNISYTALYNLILKPKDLGFTDYISERFPKRQIVWHHSAGWDNARGMFDWWMKDSQRNVATAIGIDDAGDLYRGFDEGFWAHHIGMSNNFNLARNRESIAVEICNMGSLIKDNDGNYLTWINDYGKKGKATMFLNKDKVIALDYKGFFHYERYTDAEIRTLKYWTLLQSLYWDIPVNYSEEDMFPPRKGSSWTVSNKAVSGVSGLYTHNSFISWKNDVSPQPHLIKMAEELSKYQNS